MICKAPAVGGLAVQAVAGRTGVCGIPGAQMRGHSTPRTKTCPWGPGPGAPILEGLRSVPPATRLTWTWRSTRQPVWRPALPYRAGDRRYLIVQETGATLSCRRPALLYRAGDRRYLIVQESGATLSCRRPALPYRAGERRYLIVQDTGATLSCRIPALPYRAGDRRYLCRAGCGCGHLRAWGSRSPTHLQKARMGHLGAWIPRSPRAREHHPTDEDLFEGTLELGDPRRVWFIVSPCLRIETWGTTNFRGERLGAVHAAWGSVSRP